MDTFLKVHGEDVIGKVETFDRMIFKGHLTRFFPQGAFTRFLRTQGVLLKDFGVYVKKASDEVREHARSVAAAAGRPLQYLASAHTRIRGKSKEELAREIAERDGIEEGLIAVFSVLETCSAFDVKGNHATHRLEAVRAQRKCLYLYFYMIDREFGFMHVRLQTWFPFEIQVYINGREWLARQFDRRGIDYQRHDNTFTRIENLAPVPAMCKRFAHRNWEKVLGVFARRVNPMLPVIARAGFGGYYWCLDQSEYATDVMFASRARLEAVYPDLRRMALDSLGAEDVMRFLSRKLHPNFKGEVGTDVKKRQPGWRIKHRMKRNSLKMYDKASVLRIETTINNPREFKILRPQRRGSKTVWRWMPMPKGVAFLWRFAEVSRLANHRYLDAIAVAPMKGEAVAELDDLCRSRTAKGRRIPAINPVAAGTVQLFQAVLDGAHLINGFRNRDLQSHLYPTRARSPIEARRRTARVSRLIARLRGHRLLAKFPASRRYRPTARGSRIMGAAIAYRNTGLPVST